MTTPVRAATNHQPGETIDAAEINLLGVVANAAADEARNALTTAQQAAEDAEGALQVPPGGIGPDLLQPNLLSGFRYEYVWNGTAYVSPAPQSIPATASADRIPGTLRGCTGPVDPLALGIIGVPGDRWTDVGA